MTCLRHVRRVRITLLNFAVSRSQRLTSSGTVIRSRGVLFFAGCGLTIVIFRDVGGQQSGSLSKNVKFQTGQDVLSNPTLTARKFRLPEQDRSAFESAASNCQKLLSMLSDIYFF